MLSISLNDFYLNRLLDKPSTASCPLAIAGRDKVKPPHELGQQFRHFEERDIFANARPRTGTEL